MSEVLYTLSYVWCAPSTSYAPHADSIPGPTRMLYISCKPRATSYTTPARLHPPRTSAAPLAYLTLGAHLQLLCTLREHPRPLCKCSTSRAGLEPPPTLCADIHHIVQTSDDLGAPTAASLHLQCLAQANTSMWNEVKWLYYVLSSGTECHCLRYITHVDASGRYIVQSAGICFKFGYIRVDALTSAMHLHGYMVQFADTSRTCLDLEG
ncbi:hypothetical protein OBBRIDRAFT_808672 [Obba rivulosa]|uniref:Uncharacterized protein n=1 Tax=Obba rivulosa TaxID=1052685 RepID=A0A8E2DFJ8_9APHY|nr:hypothetical protein OBBRIDRAFT_808672 [Obba rivulosa]